MLVNSKENSMILKNFNRKTLIQGIILGCVFVLISLIYSTSHSNYGIGNHIWNFFAGLLAPFIVDGFK
jgi:hypothetical protein